MQSPKGTRLNSLGGKVGLLMGGLLMGLVLAEGAARIIAPNQAADLLFNASDASPMNLYVIDKDTRVTTAPNIDTSIESLDYTVKIKTNELGLRGPGLSQVPTETPHWILWEIRLRCRYRLTKRTPSLDNCLPNLGHKYGMLGWMDISLGKPPFEFNKSKNIFQSNVSC